MSEEDEARRALTRLVRESGRDVLATLVRVTGDLQLAEDAVQDATIRALETWPREGVPPNPVAWLRLVARRRAVDLVRREANRGLKEEASVDRSSPTDPALGWKDPDESTLQDDLLRLVFTCCHPSLAVEAQVALALRVLCGLTTAEVARALLVPEQTMSKRLTRAKQKIAVAHIPYRVPPDDELPDRWAAVLAVVYLLFNEGYAATSGQDLHRPDLVAEAERLARLLVRLQPDDAGALGLLALVLLQDSRRDARVGPNGEVVLLRHQDRARWDRTRIAEGVTLVGEGLRRTPHRPDRYVLQAAIASCHALAPAYDQTDWAAVVSWYDVLLTVDPSPVVRLNRAAAVAEHEGPASAMTIVDEIEGLQGYALWHATRGVLLRRLGRDAEADLADAAAAALPLSDPQRVLLGGGGAGRTG